MIFNDLVRIVQWTHSVSAIKPMLMLCGGEITVPSEVKVKLFRYRPGVAQSVGRGIVLLFHDRGTRRGWVVTSTPRPHFTPGKDLVPILQEAVWASGLVWTGGKSRLHRNSIPYRPARSSYTDWATRPNFLLIPAQNKKKGVRFGGRNFSVTSGGIFSYVGC